MRRTCWCTSASRTPATWVRGAFGGGCCRCCLVARHTGSSAGLRVCGAARLPAEAQPDCRCSAQYHAVAGIWTRDMKQRTNLPQVRRLCCVWLSMAGRNHAQSCQGRALACTQPSCPVPHAPVGFPAAQDQQDPEAAGGAPASEEREERAEREPQGGEGGCGPGRHSMPKVMLAMLPRARRQRERRAPSAADCPSLEPTPHSTHSMPRVVVRPPMQVYMLYELEPAKELTGGPWYGENAFDSEFISVLQEVGSRGLGGWGWGWVAAGQVGCFPLGQVRPAVRAQRWRSGGLQRRPAAAQLAAYQHRASLHLNHNLSEPQCSEPQRNPAQATMSYIKSKGDATLQDIVRFIKETVRGVQAPAQRVCGAVAPPVLTFERGASLGTRRTRLPTHAALSSTSPHPWPHVPLVLRRASASRRCRRMTCSASST